MRKKFSLFVFLLILSNDIVHGKHRNKTKENPEHRKQELNGKWTNDRSRRSLKDDVAVQREDIKRKYYSDQKLDEDSPFWGTRGRRESSEEFENKLSLNKYLNYGGSHKFRIPNYNHKLEDDEESPFWGNRGRRHSDEIEAILFNSDTPLYKERRPDGDPFWGTRGRRYEKGNKERLNDYITNSDEDPFWGNRGRRQENEPFWGNRGRRQENEPFWGNRGRRQENDPFWGNRGRRQTETFWDSLERQNQLNQMALSDDTEPFWGNRGRRRLKLKSAIMRSIKQVKDNIKNIVGNQHSEDMVGNHGNRLLMSQFSAARLQSNPSGIQKLVDAELVAKKSDHNTMHDDRIYAEEPHYILVERSSRSSAEFDPFFISRGKKYNDFDIPKTIPSRRGAIEDLVKSVRNDPYYIARGKKDNTAGNFTIDAIHGQNIFCFLVDKILNKNKVKREGAESSDRDRRTILKNLALKLQLDPYYVSRGKKDLQKDKTGKNVYDHLVEETN